MSSDNTELVAEYITPQTPQTIYYNRYYDIVLMLKINKEILKDYKENIQYLYNLYHRIIPNRKHKRKLKEMYYDDKGVLGSYRKETTKLYKDLVNLFNEITNNDNVDYMKILNDIRTSDKFTEEDNIEYHAVINDALDFMDYVNTLPSEL